MSQRTLRIVLIVLTAFGLALASYLTYVHYANLRPVCTSGGSCFKVQTSTYSKLAGVPVALMGLLGYIAIMASLLAPESENTRFATLVLTIGGFGFSAYLTYRELFSIHAVCEECATSAGLMTIMMLLAIWRFLRGGPEEYDPQPLSAGEGPQTAGVSAS